MNIEAASKLVVQNYATSSGSTEDALDPAIITLISQLVPQVLQVFNNCIQARAAKNAAAHPNVIQRAALNVTVRKQVGWAAFRQHGQEITSALLKSAAESTDDDLIALANEANENY